MCECVCTCVRATMPAYTCVHMHVSINIMQTGTVIIIPHNETALQNNILVGR